MANTIKKLTVVGFKSIQRLEEFELRRLNVLIGANGAGKSNFVAFFDLLRELVEQRLQLAVQTEGGADACLYFGPKVTKRIVGRLYFGRNGYEFALVPTADNRLVFAEESATLAGDYGGHSRPFGSGHVEARLREHKDEGGVRGARHGVEHYVFDAVSSWVVYHFHDTSGTAGMRRPGPINDNERLRPNAENLAAFLLRIQGTHPGSYTKIRDAVRLAAPFFDDFKLRPMPATPELIQLEWTQKESDYPFRPSQLSDGTLRFICLATALLQPAPPATMLFDEPELGLHPYALTLLGSLFQGLGWQSGGNFSNQAIISTQSAPLLNEFAPEDIVVVDRTQGQSTFKRLDSTGLAGWLNEYSLGELWRKNVLGGRPGNEESPEASAIQGRRE